jgi:PBP1b-binding outer membrane lipoprotein LpoB
MKTRDMKLISVIVLVALLAPGCSKSGDKAVSRAQLITSSSWKYSSAGVDQDANGTVDFALPAGTLQTCDIDNVVTFKSDNTGIVDEGPTKCDPSLPQQTPFTWSLKNNDADFNFSAPVIAGVGGDAKIIELTSSKFSLSKQVTVSGIPFPVTVIVTLTH